MSRTLCFLLVAMLGLVSVSEGGRLPGGKDSLQLPKEIIGNINKAIASKGLSVRKLEPIESITMYLVLRFKDATMRSLNTWALSQGRQVFKKTDVGDKTVYNFDLSVGLQDNRYDGDFGVVIPDIAQVEGRLTLKGKGQTLRLKGAITVGKKGNCSAKVESTVVENQGSFDVHLEPPSVQKWTSGMAMELLVKLITKDDKNMNYLKGLLESEFNKLACKSFAK